MNNRNHRYSIYLPIAFALVLIAGMVIGSFLNRTQPIQNILLPAGHSSSSKVQNIIDYIVTDYVDTVDVTEMETDAIRGMLDDLDPHSSYISVEDFNEVNDPLLGSFEGIGIAFRIEKDTITVINTIPGGPSEKVGLMAGDRIVMIDDTLVAGIGITNNQAMRKLKGKKGTKVAVANYRRGVPKLIDFTITRDVIPTYSLDVAFMVTDDIGYVKLNKFAATTYEEFDNAVQELQEEGMTKLILDLRGNAGGYLKAAIDIADEFLANGKLIVYTQGKNRPRNYAFATDEGQLTDNQLVILIDEGTASASEIVSGAIQDNDRGLIIGRRSFGKGLVQEQLNLTDGSALRLTVARYYTPTGRCIQKPYTREDFEEYHEESMQRIMNGEAFSKDSIHFADSLKYITPAGKVVYGGGGIMPDIFVPLTTDSIHTYYNQLANKGLIFQFAFEYTDAHRQELNRFKDFDTFDKQFTMTNAAFNDLVAYAKDKGIEEKPEVIAVSKDKIGVLFKSFIGRNVLDEKGFYPIFLKIDTTFNRAVYELEKM